MSLDGGCLSFHFINTVSSRVQTPGHEYIRSYADLLQWSRKTDALPEDQIARLEILASARPEQAAAVLAYFRESRDILYRFFSSLAARKSPGKEISLLFNRALKEALQQLMFKASPFPANLEWEAAGTNLREPVWAALKSAWDILDKEDQERIKECEACGWLFLDRTRNNRKRWCSPANCGSADKARRYYHRKKAGL
ncbi:putative stress-induced transcription regulator [Anseongella ginsenosidimutans]|uniref:Putative stress-induced transcription regulator n=1 Tax=Anseongella ginsenosidimutans TaxID=496056 RepID=A0A4R3KVL0_9SPHI|nr:putative stress-induced transcription regulator [Anseongella ginsenosidimutans]